MIDAPIKEIKRLTEAQEKGLKRLGITTLRDLLYYFPVRYAHITERETIKNLSVGSTATVYGIVEKINLKKNFGKRGARAEAVIREHTGRYDQGDLVQPAVCSKNAVSQRHRFPLR
jgi:ATP-dependent DNA helicase RecG